MTSGIRYEKGIGKYRPTCDVEGCVSHHIHIQDYLHSVNMLTVDEHLYLISMMEKHIKKEGDCLIWTGTIHETGYGRTQLLGQYQAHQVAWMLGNMEDAPKGKLIRHDCIKNRACVNNLHLTIGTDQDNADDKIRDGTILNGEQISTSKLKASQVRDN